MRKILKFTSLLSLALAIITLSGCSQKIPLLDSEQSNTVDAYYNHVMETDIGFYYNNANIYQMGVPLSLHYYDKETGKNIYLCSKPECQHDGSVFCPATNSNITIYNTALYGDYIYMTGTENQEDFSIYRTKIDGTELSKLVDFIKLPVNSYLADYVSKIETFLIHRGKAYLTYSVVGRTDYHKGTHGIITVDLTTLKYETIEEIDLADNLIINNIKAYGDYVYYLMIKNNDAVSSMKRYNAVDNTLETVPLPIKEGYITNLYIFGYVIIEDEIWISCKTRKNSSSIGRNYMAYNLVSEKMREIQILDNNGTDSDEYFVYEPYGSINNEIMYDGKYLYLSKNIWTAGGTNGNIIISIFDLDGKYYAEFPVDFNNLVEKYKSSISVLNGKVYLQSRTELKSCPVQDIIDGNFAWTTEFEFTGLLKY